MANASVGTNALTDYNVTEAKMANASVGSNALVDSSVTAAKIAANAVTSNAILANAVTTAKIANANVTNIKLENSNVKLGDTTVNLGDTTYTIAGLSNITTSNATVFQRLRVTTVVEAANIAASAATGTISINYMSQPTLYYTSNATANWTLNVRSSPVETLDAVMQVGDVATVTFLATQGSTAYYPNVIQVDGATVTPKWQGGTAPTSGNVNSIDGYTITVVKTSATPTYTVFASQTKFA
jgi:hypothetical protein